jgi:beta-N-acetylhexosaminidase
MPFFEKKFSWEILMPGPLIVSLASKKLLDKEKILLASPKVGGLVLFRENYDENAVDPKEELKQLIQEIRAINPSIVIMIDHEGGRVWRFTKGFTKLPAAAEYGKIYDQNKEVALKKAFEDGLVMAQELLECGIDMSLAPVVDLDGPSNVIGKLSRAYHKEPRVVASIAEHFIRGMNQAGMPATLKHFPGHGNCVLDSHITRPEDARSMLLLQEDLQPFKILIEKDLVFTIMANFVVYPAVDPKNVAAFSETWLKGCLRMGYGFKSVIMSDCLHMKGADVGENLARLKAAFIAGNDFLMYTHQHEQNLDNLLSILEQIPDSKEAAERRMQLMASIVRKFKPEINTLPLYTSTMNTVAAHSLASVASNIESGSAMVPVHPSGSVSMTQTTEEHEANVNQGTASGKPYSVI